MHAPERVPERQKLVAHHRSCCGHTRTKMDECDEAETPERGDLSIECDQILPELFIPTLPQTCQRRRVLSFPRGRGAGASGLPGRDGGFAGTYFPRGSKNRADTCPC